LIQTQTSELALALEGWIILRNKKLVTTQLQLDSHNRNGAGDLNLNKNLHNCANTKNILIPTILCGGAGSRLWPVSRKQLPKPFIQLNDGESLLQKAFLRGASLPNISDIITVVNRDLFFKTENEYREMSHLLEKPIKSSYILEPFGRNTAPAIALASILAAEAYGPETILLILAADHLISNQKSFAEAVSKAFALAQQGKLVTFGIRPTAPETGYGYIEAKGQEVLRFVEKPSLNQAKNYLSAGNFLWNSGMFCFSVGAMLAEMAIHCPEILETTQNCLAQTKKVSGQEIDQVEIAPEHFKDVPDDSIDYAVMEKTDKVAVVTCDIGWSDIGCWRALGELTSSDDNNNHIQGDVIIHDSKNCILKSESRVIGAVGLNNLIVIDTPDALLVADKNCAQDVKKIYAELKDKDHIAYKTNITHRPWGSYTVLEEGSNFKVKRIEVKPGASLSLQMHHHRSEHWTVVSGIAKARNNEEEIILNVDGSLFIPAKHKHCLENIGSELLVLIEVQTGSYFGEDDIVRT
jgi:mannose-1-phosphate guanylyltransferase/mannose-6-phosphate isomerase